MIRISKSRLLLLFAMLCLTKLNAQFISATIGIDGLTCSACSFATEKSIKKLNFVDSVFMELDKNIATVYFKKGIPVSMALLSKKVYDAGFAVRSVFASFDFNNVTITNEYCFSFQNNMYEFIKIDSEKKLNSITTIKFIGEKYMSKKEFKNWKLLCKSTCSQGIDANSPFSILYYVTVP